MNKEVDRDYKELLENYEDALMRVIMYRVAQEEGARLLEETEELERSGFEVPRELDEKCLKLIRETAAPQERRQSSGLPEDCKADFPRRLRLRTVGRVLIAAILAAILSFCIAYAANDDFRVNILNFFLELQENGTQFFFRSGGTGETAPTRFEVSGEEGEFPFEFTYIPDGYELLKQEIYDLGENKIGSHSRYGYPNDEYNNFYFEIFPIYESTGLLFDTEDAIVTNINIHGYEGWQVQKTDPISGREILMFFWFDLENGESFDYGSVGVSYEESNKIFNGIVIHQ